MPARVSDAMPPDFITRAFEDATPVTKRIQAGYRLPPEKRGFKDPAECAKTDAERYAYAVIERIGPLLRVSRSLKLAADFIRGPAAFPDYGHGIGEVLRYHLIVHRAMMGAALDTMIRLVACVWNLNVPSKLLSVKRLKAEPQITPEVSRALDAVVHVVGAHVEERHEVLHAGGNPTVPDFDWGRVYAFADESEPHERGEAMVKGVAKEREKIAAAIDAELIALKAAHQRVFTALEPLYVRHFEACKPKS